MSTHPRLRRALAWTGGVLGVATALTVAIHLGPVREMLGWKPLGAAVADSTGGTSSGWCPFGFGASASDGTAIAVRPRPHTAPDPAKAVALGRPALGFTLDVTTRDEVLAWATAHGVACRTIQGSTLECSDIPVAALPAGENALGLTTAWFSFPFDDKLELVKTVRTGPDARTVAAAFDGEQSVLTAKAGGPSQRDGAADAGELALGELRQAHAEFQFQNYRATLRATNMGKQGYVLTEMYAAIL